jgi:endonuclease/exonuclease/phosphatase (EEP) superfamily protein YafD
MKERPAMSFMRRIARDVCLLALAGLTVVTINLPLAPADSMLSLATHFVPQYLLGAFVALVLSVVWRNRLAGVAAIGFVLIHGWLVFPYLPMPGQAHAAGSGAARVMVCNVLTGNSNKAALLSEVVRHDPDVLLLQEVDHAWVEATGKLDALYPHRMDVPRGDNFGISLLSKFPMRDAQIVELGGADVPAIHAEIQLGETWVDFLGLHTLPPIRAIYRTGSLNQMTEVATYSAAAEGGFILAGDLNNTMWSPAYRALRKATGLRNARAGRGLLGTWPGDGVLRIPIDHVLVNDALAIDRCFAGSYFGSDHLPLIVDLTVRISRDG